ncbi:MAG TPA: ATP-binding protein [Coriobacteriia bacterium]|jgi:serine/threonine-protein kinase RsbW
MASDRIALSVPARGEYARTVRMTAAELASRMGMSIDDIDDVRIAVEESFALAVAHASGADVTFTFTLDPEAFEAAATTPSNTCDEDLEDETGSRYARFILESVCDEFEIRTDDGACYIRLLKRIS